MRLPFLVATFRTDRPVRGSATLLRGFFAHRQPENVLLHQHAGDGESARFVYLYPRVQYRIRGGVARLIGVDDGITAISHATQRLDALELSGRQYRVDNIEFEESEIEIAEEAEPREFRFASPWLALNQGNYLRYQQSGQGDRMELLQRTLVANVLSMSKSFGFRVTERLHASVRLRPVPMHVKGQTMLGFLGRFSVNFSLAPRLGLGHLVSVGFGEVEPCNNRND